MDLIEDANRILPASGSLNKNGSSKININADLVIDE